MRIAVLISNGTEEIEVVTPVDVLRRSGALVDLVSVVDKQIIGSHGIVITADKQIEEICEEDYDGIVIPGGMPGAKIISENKTAISIISSMMKKGKMVAAICASPAVVLASHGLIECVNATCYPAKEFVELINNYTGANVEVDKNVITANGPKSAMEFSIKICEYLKLPCGI